jgi:DsbC/DsbD-like thiol-disulfide interchange protein
MTDSNCLKFTLTCPDLGAKVGSLPAKPDLGAKVECLPAKSSTSIYGPDDQKGPDSNNNPVIELILESTKKHIPRRKSPSKRPKKLRIKASKSPDNLQATLSLLKKPKRKKIKSVKAFPDPLS